MILTKIFQIKKSFVFNFYFFSKYFCFIDLKRHSEHSRLRLVLFVFLFKLEFLEIFRQLFRFYSYLSSKGKAAILSYRRQKLSPVVTTYFSRLPSLVSVGSILIDGICFSGSSFAIGFVAFFKYFRVVSRQVYIWASGTYFLKIKNNSVK